MKVEILRQMEITEHLTNQAKGNRKSYLEIENNNIIKQRKLREEQRQYEQNACLKIEDNDKIENDSQVESDADVVNEVTISCEDTTQDDDEHNDVIGDDIKRTKNNTANKNKKRNDESK